MASEIISALEALEKEKGIKKEYMLERISQALVAAYKALYKRDTQASAIENVFVNINEKSGAISMVAVKTVFEEVENPATEISLLEAEAYSKVPAIGDQVRVPVNMKAFGRIATQTAKQCERAVFVALECAHHVTCAVLRLVKSELNLFALCPVVMLLT